MSFLEQLCKKKSVLKSTDTIVTRPDGRRYVESKGNIDLEIAEKSFGFVVDTKPDNIPAQITENIYLGSQDCCELKVLQEFSIYYVLSIGIEPPCVYPNVIYKFVKCLDLPETDIITILADCIPFIKEAVGQYKNILVHCNAGVSRSSAIVLGFLIFVNNLTYNEAYNIVKSKRSCIKPNDGFEKQLKAFRRP